MVWLFVCLIAFIFEIITPGALVSVWFLIGGLGALLVSLLHWSFEIQIALFFALSLLCIILVRPIVSRYFYKQKVPTNFDRLIGETGLVVKDITRDSWGQVSVQGKIWHAISEHKDGIQQGVRVKIVAIDGVKLVVTPLDIK